MLIIDEQVVKCNAISVVVAWYELRGEGRSRFKAGIRNDGAGRWGGHLI